MIYFTMIYITMIYITVIYFTVIYFRMIHFGLYYNIFRYGSPRIIIIWQPFHLLLPFPTIRDCIRDIVIWCRHQLVTLIRIIIFIYLFIYYRPLSSLVSLPPYYNSSARCHSNTSVTRSWPTYSFRHWLPVAITTAGTGRSSNRSWAVICWPTLLRYVQYGW